MMPQVQCSKKCDDGYIDQYLEYFQKAKEMVFRYYRECWHHTVTMIA